MTAREIAEELGLKHITQVSAALGPFRGTLVRVGGWRRDEDGGRLYPRALYAAGPGVDAPKPEKLPRSEYNRRARHKLRSQVASVWELGLQARSFYNKATRQAARAAPSERIAA